MTAIGAVGTGAADVAAETRHRKLVDAAQQFEAVFLNEMLKPMNASGQIGGDDDGGSGQGGTLQQFGTEAMAKAIAAAGGMGIARHVVAEVERQQAKREPEKNLQTGLKS